MANFEFVTRFRMILALKCAISSSLEPVVLRFIWIAWTFSCIVDSFSIIFEHLLCLHMAINILTALHANIEVFYYMWHAKCVDIGMENVENIEQSIGFRFNRKRIFFHFKCTLWVWSHVETDVRLLVQLICLP